MAIIFISPKKRQRILFWSGAVIFFLALAGICTWALLPEIKNQLAVVPATDSFTMPDVNINFSLVDSNKVKNLQSFNNAISQEASLGRTDPFTAYYQSLKK